jgi:hypothetical protein
VLINDKLLQFCADKTREITAEYQSCLAADDDGFPRSDGDLHWIMSNRYGLPIYHKEMAVLWTQTTVRSIYIPYADKFDIWYAQGMPPEYVRYYKTKELMQIHLREEAAITEDIVELVRTMILRESPASLTTNLGPQATADTLGELAAEEFLFPLARRLTCGNPAQGDGVNALAAEYGIPPFVVDRALRNTDMLQKYFL